MFGLGRIAKAMEHRNGIERTKLKLIEAQTQLMLEYVRAAGAAQSAALAQRDQSPDMMKLFNDAMERLMPKEVSDGPKISG